MQLLYKKLLEVEIKHDYFLLPGPTEKYPASYDISAIIDITPSAATAQFMRDHKMIFRYTATGFSIFILAEFISTAAGHASVVDIDPAIVLSFYWSLKDKRFINFTNQRLIEDGKRIYYFSSRSASQQGGILYLNNAVQPFGTTYFGEPFYRLGDIISEGGETYEMIDKDAPTTNFPANASKWQKISTAVINYVNPADRLRWRSPSFHHERANTSPGEFITYRLLDVNGQPVETGDIPGTDIPQNEYRASTDSNERVNHTLDLAAAIPGKYTLEITESTGITTHSFYLLDPVIMPDLVGVSEFFITGVAAPFQFIKEDAVLKRWILDNPHKKFRIRFRNRLTRWRYFKQDQTIAHEPVTPRPLTWSYSGYQASIGGGAPVNLPDPAVHPLVPDVEAATQLVKNIYSPIFLSK